MVSVGRRPWSRIGAYDVDGLIVFANEYGDAITFDGWIIRSVLGFNLSNSLSVSGGSGIRKILDGGSTKITNCGTWVRRELTWIQTCGNGRGSIVLNESGEILAISTPLGDSLGDVTLRRQ